MFDRIRSWFAWMKPDVIVREEVESDERRCPKLAALTQSLEYYVQLHEDSIRLMNELPVTKAGEPGRKWYERQISNAYNNRVVATWGMIAKGVEALPFALKMLKSRDGDVREDGAGVLTAIGKQPGVVEELLGTLERVTDTQSLDAVILALGEMKDKCAIPALARIIRQPDVDGDTQWTAIEALERIVRRKFIERPDAVEAALEWLESHGQ